MQRRCEYKISCHKTSTIYFQFAFLFCSHANVALNLQPKVNETKGETNEMPASVSTEAGGAQSREYKIRKTDDDSKENSAFATTQDEKMELIAGAKSSEDISMQTLPDTAKSSGVMQESLVRSEQSERMEMSSPEPATTGSCNVNEDDHEIGEIYIVSI